LKKQFKETKIQLGLGDGVIIDLKKRKRNDEVSE